MTAFTAIITSFLGLTLVQGPHPSAHSKVPVTQATGEWNVVLFLMDDLGWNDLSCLGSDYYETPRIDALAAEGMQFSDAYSNAPNCAPSRACLISGLYGPRHGVFTVGSPNRGNSKDRYLIPPSNRTVLDPQFTTIAEVLQGADYQTAIMGKWHLGGDPTTQGFDLDVCKGVKRGSIGAPRSFFRPFGNVAIGDGPEGEYLSDRLAQEAVSFLDSVDDKPFFLYLPHFAVHTPIQAPEATVARYRSKEPGERHFDPTYAAMIDHMDQAVGRVLDALERNGQAERTIVIFTSDNGGYGPITSMEPLRGSKGMLYEGGIRVPMFVRWPGVVEPGSSSDEPVIGLDLYPTILDALGIPRPEGLELDGESFVPILKGTASSLKRQALYWHFPAYLERYSTTIGPFRTTPASAIRLGDWKLIEFFEDRRLELYHLGTDLSESNDRSEEEPERVLELLRELHRWRLETNAPIPERLNPEFNPVQRFQSDQERAVRARP